MAEGFAQILKLSLGEGNGKPTSVSLPLNRHMSSSIDSTSATDVKDTSQDDGVSPGNGGYSETSKVLTCENLTMLFRMLGHGMSKL